MSIWRATRDELRGAWRSVRYDLARRTHQSTDGGTADPNFDPFEGGPRRVIVSAGVAALVVGGAVGSYFGVVNGLGSLLERPPAPGALPAAAGDADDVTAPAASPAPPRSPGRGGPDVASVPGTRAVPVAGGSPSAARPAGTPAVGRATVRPVSPPETGQPGVPVPTPAPSYECETPPTPTPTPAEPTASPDAEGEQPAEPAGPAESPSPTAEFSDTGSDGGRTS